jgi:hypothetical protein
MGQILRTSSGFVRGHEEIFAMKQQLRGILIWLAIVFGTTACVWISRQSPTDILNSIPVYPGAELVHETRTGWPDSSPNITRTYSVSDSAEEVLAFYESSLPENGWVIQERWGMEFDNVTKQLIFEKNGWQASVLIEPSGNFALRVYLH